MHWTATERTTEEFGPAGLLALGEQAATAETSQASQRNPSFAASSHSRKSQLRVAYVMSRFPKLTETFVLFEMKAVEELGAVVELYPLWRERTRVMHSEAKPYVDRAHFQQLFSWKTLVANLVCLVHSPRTYVAALTLGLRANWGSARFLCGFIAAFPKAVVFAKEMQKERIDHIHAHFASHPAAVALVVHRLTGIPFSFTAHGSDLHRDTHMLREKVAEAAFVVAISTFNRDVIVSECGRASASKIRVIHCGVDLRVFRPGTQDSTAAVQDPALQMACLGTLHEVKGQRHLIEACRLLRERNVTFHLHLIGSGPDAAELQALVIQAGLRELVTFHGNLPRQKVADLLRKMHVVVAPSVPTKDGRREGIPVALMEAMATGLPVVASRLSGIPELVSDEVQGRLVTPGDSRAIADTLEELAQQPRLRQLWGQAARKTIEQHFNQTGNASKLIHEIHKARTKDERSAPIRSEVAR